MTLRARLATLIRRLLPPSLPPVVAHPIACGICRGSGGYLTIDFEHRTCAACRHSPGVEGWGFCRAGVTLGSLSAELIDAEGAERLALRLCRLSDEEARAVVTATRSSPIEIRLPGSPPRTVDTRAEALGYLIGCWLRRRWPFDRRREVREVGVERRRP